MVVSTVLSSTEVCDKGLHILKIDEENRWCREKREIRFKEQYGNKPLILALVWYKLTVYDFEEGLKLKAFEKEQRGLKMFLISIFFVWTYPKNAGVLSAHFGISKDFCQGRPLWIWIERVAALKTKKIVWLRELDDPNAELFIISIDGTDFKTWEKKHPTLNQDRKQFTKKHKHGGLNYQVVLSVHHQQVVDIYGPCQGGISDKAMLHESGVLVRIKNQKLAIVDLGYINYANKENLSWPNQHDAQAVNNFKSRARLRHETLTMLFFRNFNLYIS